jgi:hypothetical protein
VDVIKSDEPIEMVFFRTPIDQQIEDEIKELKKILSGEKVGSKGGFFVLLTN